MPLYSPEAFQDFFLDKVCLRSFLSLLNMFSHKSQMGPPLSPVHNKRNISCCTGQEGKEVRGELLLPFVNLHAACEIDVIMDHKHHVNGKRLID
jgi:hypothetical protein